MIRKLREFNQLLDDLSLRRSDIMTLLGLTVLFVILEGGGVALLMPLLVFVESGSQGLTDDQGVFMRLFLETIAYLDLPVNAATLLIFAAVPLISRQFVSYIRSVLTAKIRNQTLSDIRGRHIRHYLNADIGFFTANKAGELSSNVIVEADRASTVGQAVIAMVSAGFLLTVYGALLFLFFPALAAITLPLIAGMGLIFRRLIRDSRRIGAEVSEMYVAMSVGLNETFSGIRLFKMYSHEKAMTDKLMAEVDSICDNNVQLEKFRAFIEAAGQVALLVVVFGIMYVAIAVLNFRLAELGMFAFIAMRTVPLVIQFHSFRVSFHGLMESVIRTRRVLALATDMHTITDGELTFEGFRHELKFDNVSFSYRSGNDAVPVINEVSFTARPGETVAIVGRSGAGKSTLIDLIPRLQDPSGGAITLDGVSVQHYRLASLRRKIAFLQQEPIIFHATVRANLVFGLDTQPSDEKIFEALRQSNANGFVAALPNGLDSMLGDRGHSLSGGQRQRLSLARALLLEPDILLLDEPTSALDSESEAAIQNSLTEIHGKLCTIIIAHRLATVQHADKIVVLDEGKVVATGTHHSLMEQDGVYRRLFAQQMAGGSAPKPISLVE